VLPFQLHVSASAVLPFQPPNSTAVPVAGLNAICAASRADGAVEGAACVHRFPSKVHVSPRKLPLYPPNSTSRDRVVSATIDGRVRPLGLAPPGGTLRHPGDGNTRAPLDVAAGTTAGLSAEDDTAAESVAAGRAPPAPPTPRGPLPLVAVDSPTATPAAGTDAAGGSAAAGGDADAGAAPARASETPPGLPAVGRAGPGAAGVASPAGDALVAGAATVVAAVGAAALTAGAWLTATTTSTDISGTITRRATTETPGASGTSTGGNP